jgi:nucleoside-diphosphate-sugar epimerase
MQQKNVALFGSTGHIGKNLISFFLKDDSFKLFLFSRDATKFKSLGILFPETVSFNQYDDFEKNEYDVIINCIGISNPNELIQNQLPLFDILEFYDNIILNYLKNHPTTFYINLSSGAVFGRDFPSPVDDDSVSTFQINKIDKGEMYSLSKIYSESKHRCLPDFNIIDLRIFGFFSRFIDVNSGFFISELIKAIKNNSEFITDKEDVVRDYIDPSDFYELIKNCIHQKKINNVFDVYSKKPISKFEILEEFSNKFELKYHITKNFGLVSPTGLKKIYYSLSRKATKINYVPQFSSLETLLNESSFILEPNSKSFDQNIPKKS